ncbi:amidohydrolase [Tateyamaria omphalii]|uniref:amidohydrolase family protein n=1 Tax=Tateyamaria omphalii TaxID=299262 RepID=UPI0019A408FA|nr:amidohydrolase family protein [Tateyamaria omphalii]GGX44027.1 amidohydrolase [Tateyamaria omphalii]
MTDVLVPKSMISDPHRFGGVDHGDCVHGTPIVKDGQLIALDAPTQTATKMVLPRLVEPHCHLDKCHTVQRLKNVGGDLHHALASQRADKVHWDEDDIRARASKGLKEAHENGCGLIRSHVDWGDEPAPPLSWSVLVELAEDHSGLQLSALTSIEQWIHPEFSETVGKVLEFTDGVLGAFVHGHEKTRAGLEALFATAIRHNLMLDFHVDEGLGALHGLEQIADVALETGFDRPILCGHCVSLIDKPSHEVQRIADKLVRAHITVCALPMTNLYLQGRTDGTPDRRGITRLKELRDAGVPVVVGSDNVADAFCPVGAHDPRAALALACVAAHLDPPMGDWLPAITTDAARALGATAATVDGAHLADMLTCDVTHTANLLSGRVPLRAAPDTLM